jgi:major membrane immunogen (membrane-anchored lipoprotein)
MMQTKYLISGVACLGLLLGGCMGSSTKADMKKDEMTPPPMEMDKKPMAMEYQPTAEGAKMAIAAADESRKKAGKVAGEWRDTAKILKKAKAAEKAGDFSKAIKLAKTAWSQGQNGYEQAMSQQELVIPSYLK